MSETAWAIVGLMALFGPFVLYVAWIILIR